MGVVLVAAGGSALAVSAVPLVMFGRLSSAGCHSQAKSPDFPSVFGLSINHPSMERQESVRIGPE